MTREMTDYRVYRLSRMERLASAAVGMLVAFGAGYLLYRSVAVAMVISLPGLLGPRWYTSYALQRRQQQLRLQFKEVLFSLTSSLAAGRSVENAFRTVADDLRFLYPDQSAALIREFDWLRHRLDNGDTIEAALQDFSDRTGVEETGHFTEVFCIAKRSGGDLVEVIRRTSEVMGEKLDIQLEIQVMIAQKKFESRIMMAVPFVFLGFLGLVAPDYMAPLYSGIGYVVLTGTLLLLLLSYWLMARIMDLKL